jgi:hypothetical protein
MSLNGQKPEAAKQEESGSCRHNPKEGLADWLNRISRETAAIMNDGRTSKEIMDELYDDETGLPK